MPPEPGRPIEGTDEGYVLNLAQQERDLLVQLMGELESLLEEDDHPYVARLFPVAYPDDDEAEAEYQRLMREELVISRSANIELVKELVARPEGATMTEAETLGWMQSLNAIRVVLGTMLGIDDDEDRRTDRPQRRLRRPALRLPLLPPGVDRPEPLRPLTAIS